MIMQWDGQKVTGVINPGPKAIQIADAKLIPEGWRVTVAATTASGENVAFEGTIAELGAYNRSISGTWTEGGRRNSAFAWCVSSALATPMRKLIGLTLLAAIVGATFWL